MFSLFTIGILCGGNEFVFWTFESYSLHHYIKNNLKIDLQLQNENSLQFRLGSRINKLHMKTKFVIPFCVLITLHQQLTILFPG